MFDYKQSKQLKQFKQFPLKSTFTRFKAKHQRWRCLVTAIGLVIFSNLLSPATIMARGLQIVGGSFTDTSSFGGFITLHPTTNQLSYWYIHTQTNQGMAGAFYAPGAGDTARIEKIINSETGDRLKLVFYDSKTKQVLELVLDQANLENLDNAIVVGTIGIQNSSHPALSSDGNQDAQDMHGLNQPNFSPIDSPVTREISADRDRRAFRGAKLVEVDY
ncbi:hypothetical protein Pse7367_3543 [Thalassoporum mexicanum PCC 7367]|nr:hypothetical protein Pse7367_3543 [Pseudanabaena sp. PCC 7367]